MHPPTLLWNWIEDGSKPVPRWPSMGTRKDGLEVDHIPFPMPEGRWILRQNWKKLTLLHWKVEPAVIRAHLPDDLELDLYQGEAYVGCIPFVMENVRPSGLPAVPGISTFGEFNIRTYVTKNGVPGVFFLTLDAKSRVTCLYANWRYGLTYRYANSKVKGTLESGYEWSSARSGGSFALRGSSQPASEMRQAEPGSLEYFLFERYSLYTVRKGRLHHGYTHHIKWEYCDANVVVEENTLVEGYNLGIEDTTQPELTHMSKGVEVVTWHLLPLGG